MRNTKSWLYVKSSQSPPHFSMHQPHHWSWASYNIILYTPEIMHSTRGWGRVRLVQLNSKWWIRLKFPFWIQTPPHMQTLHQIRAIISFEHFHCLRCHTMIKDVRVRVHHAPLLDSISGDLNYVTSCCFVKVIKRILPYMGIWCLFLVGRQHSWPYMGISLWYLWINSLLASWTSLRSSTPT